MRRWDRLVDAYVEEYRARGVSQQSVAYTQARLDRWGRWLKGRRLRNSIERIDAELLTRYIASCSSFRAKATAYATLSTMRGFGDRLVRQGLWQINPLRWMKGRKVTPYSRLRNTFMKNINTAGMDPWIEGYLSHLAEVGRKTPRTIIDVRCTLRRATAHFEPTRPGIALWHLMLGDYLHWLEAERQRRLDGQQSGEISQPRAGTARG